MGNGEERRKLTYNTERGAVRVPQAGRLFNKSVEHVYRSVDDPEKRARLYGALAEVFASARTRGRPTDPAYMTMWVYMGKILGYIPEGCPYRIEEAVLPEKLSPARLKYPVRAWDEARSLGKFIKRWVFLIEKVDDREKRRIHTAVLAQFLRYLIRKWEKRPVDETILKEYIKKLSGGILEFDASVELPQSEYAGGKNRKNS